MVGIFKNNLLCYIFHLHISCTRSIHYIRFREFWFIFMAFCCKMNSTKECYYLSELPKDCVCVSRLKAFPGEMFFLYICICAT